MLHTYSLDEPNASDVVLSGKKAAGLAILRRNFAVPAGFVISASSMSQVLKRPRDRQESSPFEKTEIEILVRLALSLPTSRVAVRSSSLLEDDADHSYAGQFHTELNVSPDRVPHEVLRCARSSLGERSKIYGALSGQAPWKAPIAVVIQEMVDARVAGVMFTCDPVAVDSSVLVVEAVPGLGEALVSGVTTPDRFVVAKDGLLLLNYATASGVRGTWPGAAAERLGSLGSTTLSYEELRDLAITGVQIERLAGCAQDIEWAIDQRGHVKILQARPVTTTKGRSLQGFDDVPFFG